MGMIQAPNQTPADRLDQMVQQYEKDLLRICCIYLRDRTAAEDVVEGFQEHGFFSWGKQ